MDNSDCYGKYELRKWTFNIWPCGDFTSNRAFHSTAGPIF